MAERTTVTFDDDVLAAMNEIRGNALKNEGREIPVARLMNDLLRKALGIKEKR